EFKHLPLGRPQYIGVVGPKDAQGKTKLVEMLMKGKDLYMLPRYYVPYAQEAQAALNHAKSLDALRKHAPDLVNDYLSASSRSESSVRYLPLRGARGDAAVFLDATSGIPLKIILVDPW